MPHGFVDCETTTGEIIPGDWRKVTKGDSSGLLQLNQISGNMQGFEVDKVREDFQMFFNSKEGELPWQLDYVQDNSKMES